MQLLFVNDTSGTSNPGCGAVMDALRRAYGRPAPEQCASVPLGVWAEPFRPLAATSKQCVVRGGAAFPVGTEEAPAVDLAAWRELAGERGRTDVDLVRALEDCERVVLNGEGSIHHNFPRALALLAVAREAARRGRPVELVNCTLQGMDPDLLREVLPALARVHVREARTSALLKALEIPHEHTPDVAFGADYGAADPGAPAPGTCLLTSGVLVHPRSLPAQLDAVRAAGLEPTYLSIGDGGEGEVTRELCRGAGVEWIDAGSLAWQDLPRFLSGYELAVSGRHHVNVFLCLAGVPFVPLPSNTWKIEATLEQVGYPLRPARDGEELGAALHAARERRDELATAARSAGERGRAAVRNWQERVRWS